MFDTDPATTAAKQTRTFDYDGRGFLREEVHPESGTTTYSSYDARGHATQRQTATTTLQFSFDFAERLRTVTSGGTVLKEFKYASANGATNYKKGKLESARRRNALPSAGTIDVTETYTYGAPSGQVSQRKTVVERVDGTTTTKLQEFVT